MDLRTETLQGENAPTGQTVYVDPCVHPVGDIQLGDDASIWPWWPPEWGRQPYPHRCPQQYQDGTVLHLTRKSASNPGGYPPLIGEDVTVPVIKPRCTVAP